MKEYTLFNKTVPIFDFDMESDMDTILNIGKIYNPEYAPMSLTKVNGNFDKKSFRTWWRERAIPASRSGLRTALEIMGIQESTDLLLKCNGFSLSDQYWIKEKGTDLDWNAVNFFDNEFSEDVGNALFGNKIVNIDLISPNNTSDGWLKKKWKIVNNERVLLKAGSGSELQEPLNEEFVSIINKSIGYENFVEYETLWEEDKPLSCCKNFVTPNTELVTAWTVRNQLKKSNNDSEYTHYKKCCEYLGINPKETQDYLDYMITLDYLVVNQDRHFNNFGVIRDVNTLKILGHAPIFDTGTSLWNGIATRLIKSTIQNESKPFKQYHEEQIKLINISEKFSLLNSEYLLNEFNKLLASSIYIEDYRRKILVSSFEGRLNLLNKRVERGMNSFT